MSDSLNKSNISWVVTEDIERNLNKFLALFPNNSLNNHKKLLWIIKLLWWTLVKHNSWNVDLSKVDNFKDAEKKIKKLIKIENIKPLHIAHILESYGRPIFEDWSIGDQKCLNYNLTSDSNVYLLEWKDLIMKIYFYLNKNEITNYHKFQNKIAKQEYTLSYNWEINDDKIEKIDIKILELPENNVIGNNNSSISFIPLSKYKNLSSYGIKKDSPILKEIMRIIKEKNWITNFPESIHPMNIQVISIENWTLSIIITDIADDITSILTWEKLIDLKSRKIESASETIKRLVKSLISLV